MELKMLHEPLTPKQQAMYNGEVAYEVENGHTKVIPNLATAMTKEVAELDPTTAPTIQFPAADLEEIQVKTMMIVHIIPSISRRRWQRAWQN